MYNQKAFEILSSSIKSAVFIDEKARDFYSDLKEETEGEEKLSIDLFKAFKENGKSLIVHKFAKADVDDEKRIEYLFSGKDLILLDWELDELDGQDHSLALLSKAIELPYINFCCIYSRSANFDTIPLFLKAFFSGLTKDEFDTIGDKYSYLEIVDIDNFKRNPENNLKAFFEDNDIVLEEFPIERFQNKKEDLIIDLIAIALQKEKYFYQKAKISEHEVIYSSENSFVINNTFVLAIKKEEEDSDFGSLIRRISDEIVKNKSSFFQLLGLEMQSLFNSNERFIDETILKSSTEALFRFRNHLKNDKAFGIIIKKLLLEQATLKLRTAKLELLKPEFLDFKSEELRGDPVDKEDLFQLNVFYNSVKVKGLVDDDIPNLNFGDVFIDEKGNYYLCITALCDCYDPNKIQGNFYFVVGKVFKNIDLALRLGDTSFINFLPNNTAVYWGNLESAKFAEIPKQQEGESIDAYRVRKLSNEIEGYKQFLYKPFYVKPQAFNVENNKLVDNKLRMWDISNKYSQEEIKQDLNCFNLTYITTLRNDYTQRIANHAFGHPTRVGVDFVKI